MQLDNGIFEIKNDDDFIQASLEVFKYQYENVKLYKEFCDLLKMKPSSINEISDIPFLPIEFFKSYQIGDSSNYDKLFLSSGTTQQEKSKHFVKNINVYKRSFLNGFNTFYGNPSDFLIAAILPGYVDNPNSSLLYMVDQLIKDSNDPLSGFYRFENDHLIDQLNQIQASNTKNKLIIGVSFALLDIAEKHKTDLSDCIIMETGGMKGKRKEIVREELHSILKESFNINTIHSEYGMTELLSQAYSKGGGVFEESSTMKVLIRNIYQPLQTLSINNSGGINVIDLSNIYSLSFIASQDLGKKLSSSTFEVLGRFDQADIRGCNLLHS
jgi:phenylacetate-coenzyme A ligase PaaK-like adenylate-forming protein